MTLDRSNPFASPSTLPFELPDFAAIRAEHYQAAIEAGMAATHARCADSEVRLPPLGEEWR